MIDADKLRALDDEATTGELTGCGRYIGERYDAFIEDANFSTADYNRAADGRLVQYLWNNRTAILAMAEERERLIAENLGLAREISELRSDLAVMREHDCTEVKRLREVCASNAATMEEQVRRFRRLGQSTSELGTAIAETRRALGEEKA